MSRYVDLSEKVTATYYDEQYKEWDHHTVTVEDVLNEVCDDYTVLPSAEPDDWTERNKERILQAGMEGREIEFRIGGRLFAIREKAQ